MEVGVELPGFFIAEEWAPTLRTEDEVHNDVGK
jgi:hypothetical protein